MQQMIEYASRLPRTRDRRLAAPSRTTLVDLGRLDSVDMAQAALNALHRVRALWDAEAELIIVDSDGSPGNLLQSDDHCRTHSITAVVHMLRACRGRVLVPVRHESFAAAHLHALASGIPLTSLNYVARPDDEAPVLHRHDGFLALGRKAVFCEPH